MYNLWKLYIKVLSRDKVPALSEIKGKSRQRQITKQHPQKFCVINSYTQRGCQGTKRQPRESDIEERVEGRLPGWGQETMAGGDCRFKASETGEGVGCWGYGTQPGKSRDTEGQVVSLILEKKQK